MDLQSISFSILQLESVVAARLYLSLAATVDLKPFCHMQLLL